MEKRFYTNISSLNNIDVEVICDGNTIYTNKVSLQKQLNKLIGEPTKEDKIKRSIAGSRWDIPLSDKTKISRMILKANIYEI